MESSSAGLEPLKSFAIFVAALFLLSTQREIPSMDDIILDGERHKNVPKQEKDDPAQTLPEMENRIAIVEEEDGHTNSVIVEEEDGHTNSVTEIAEENIKDDVVTIKVEEELDRSIDTSPTTPTSNAPTIQYTTPNIDDMKRRVASTLASEKAKKERLDAEFEIKTSQSVERATKSELIDFPRKTKKKSRIWIRLAKKVLMPWKKFSQLP